MLPRIPKLADAGDPAASDFWEFAEAGRCDLAELHLDYEDVEPYPLVEVRPPGADLRVTKMRFAGKAGAWDKSTIRYNDQITLSGIPPEAHEYLLGSRSAIEFRWGRTTTEESFRPTPYEIYGLDMTLIESCSSEFITYGRNEPPRA